MKAVRLVVHGRVQGVFYRDWTVRSAKALGLTGWVRNCPDGTVDALVQGDASAVDRMVERMHSGPPAARVDRIDQSVSNPEELSDFIRR